MRFVVTLNNNHIIPLSPTYRTRYNFEIYIAICYTRIIPLSISPQNLTSIHCAFVNVAAVSNAGRRNMLSQPHKFLTIIILPVCYTQLQLCVCTMYTSSTVYTNTKQEIQYYLFQISLHIYLWRCTICVCVCMMMRVRGTINVTISSSHLPLLIQNILQ